MNNDYLDMYNHIHADEKLKQKTIRFMQNELNRSYLKKSKTQKIFRVAVVCLAFILVFGAGMEIYTVKAEDSYITLESDASIGISVNRWNKVIKVNSGNEEADKMIEQLKLVGMNYDEAIESILEYVTDTHNDIENSGLKVSVDCNRQDHAEEIQEKIDKACNNYQYKNKQQHNHGNGGRQ